MLGLGMVGLALAPAAASAGTITPSDGVDGFMDGPGHCSLREAIQAAQTDGDFDGCVIPGGDVDEDTIQLQGITYTLSDLGTADPTVDDDTNADDDLDILGEIGAPGDQTLNITTLGSPRAVIDGNGLVTGNRVFDLVPTAVFGDAMNLVRLSQLVITGGNTTASAGTGGALRTSSWVTDTQISSSHIHENTGGDGGGAMRLGADMTITDSWIEDNEAPGSGAIWSDGDGDITIVGSTLSDNRSVDGWGYEGDGGALLLSGAAGATGSLTMVNSTVSGNEATGDAGGIYTFGGTGMELTSASSTIAGNTADSDTDTAAMSEATSEASWSRAPRTPSRSSATRSSAATSTKVGRFPIATVRWSRRATTCCRAPPARATAHPPCSAWRAMTCLA